jgi:hypothetical protein
MIDIAREQLISLHDVPKVLPPGPSGKRLHISAIYRWAQRGIRGTRLEVVRVGGTTYTSREALQRFVQPAEIAKPVKTQNSTARCIKSILNN